MGRCASESVNRRAMRLQRVRRISATWSERLDESRIRLARPDALLPLAVLGLLTGLLAGVVIVLFRLVEGIQDAAAGRRRGELRGLARLGASLAADRRRSAAGRDVSLGGEGHQMLGVARSWNAWPITRAIDATGVSAAVLWRGIAIIGGHSVGREGPHVYLGSSSGSLLGHKLSLPNNAIRTLVGCGTAAGIAASFNTPLAGVAFALEVVMMEYRVASFIPVILAAVSATTLSNVVLGTEPAFAVPTMRWWITLAEVGFWSSGRRCVVGRFYQLVQFVARVARAGDLVAHAAGGRFGGVRRCCCRR